MFKNALLSLFVVAAAHAASYVQAEAEVSAVTEVNAATEVAQDFGVTLAVISVASAVLPLIENLIKNRKQCRQVACWISTPTCYQQAADQVQNQIFKGRDGYRIESHNNEGAWVRYWRVKTDISTINTIATGKCDNGKSFVVKNCQTTGSVHC
ncbi:hypothetical protein FI667_g15012, partial [Globisporangium splendens]